MSRDPSFGPKVSGRPDRQPEQSFPMVTGSCPRIAGDFRAVCALHGGLSALDVTFIQALTKPLELPELESRNHDVLGGLVRADQRRVHAVEHGALAKGVNNDLRAPALLAEEQLDRLVIRVGPARDLQPQVCAAGVEVVQKTRGRTRAAGQATTSPRWEIL